MAELGVYLMYIFVIYTQLLPVSLRQLLTISGKINCPHAGDKDYLFKSYQSRTRSFNLTMMFHMCNLGQVTHSLHASISPTIE